MLDDILKIHEAGRFDEAEQQYREFLAFNPDHPDALHLLAIVRRQLGDLREALELASKAVELAPEHAGIQQTLAGLFMHARQFELARDHFSQSLRLQPNQFGALLGLAQVTVILRDFDATREALDKADRIAADHPRTLFLRGNMAQARGEHERAVKYYLEAAKRDPNDAAIQANLAHSFLALGNDGFAEQALRNALQINPNFDMARIALAQFLLRTEQHDEALTEFEAVLARRENHPLALAGRGDIRRGRGDLVAALEDYRKAHEGAPDLASVTAALVEMMLMNGQQDEGRALLVQALNQQPGSPELRRLDLAIAVRDGGDRYLEASQAWVQAAPEQLEPLEHLLSILETRGRFDEADALARQSLQRDSRFASARLILARSALREARAQDAQEQLDRLPESSLPPTRKAERAALRGLARDALGDHVGAIDAWLNGQRMQTGLAALMPYPEPFSVSATAAASADGNDPAPCFLISLPGAGSESLVVLLRQLGASLLSDRFGQRMRADPLATGEFIPLAAKLAEDPEQATTFRERYLAALAAVDQVLEPGTVDWLPFFDTRMAALLLAAFPNARFICLQRDLRDCLLNWLALGTPHVLSAADPVAAGAWLARAGEHQRLGLASVAEDRLLHVANVELEDPGALSERLLAFLGIERPDPMPVSDAIRRGLGGLPTTLPEGRWRAYESVLAEAFRPLTP